MKKFLSLFKENILFVSTLILLAFIPLYPKIPLINVRNTWVYVRVEDFLILAVLFLWVFLLIRKKISLRTPLTMPILIFWIICAIATLNGVLLIFPTLAGVFPNVAFLALVRHIEYLSLFFAAFAAMKNRNLLRFVVATIVVTLIGVVLYGIGQKYLGFPAFLTSNEEFAKGIPIQLSQLSRIPSTFAGHYDLAAYLVIMIPIIVSLIFGIKNLLVKVSLLLVALSSFLLLFWTVSRVSFFVVFVSLFFVLMLQKRKLALVLIPLILISAVVFLSVKPALLDRFKSTVSNVDVLIDAQTGDSIGHVKITPASYFKDKIVLQRRVNNESELLSQMAGQAGNPSSSLSAILPFEYIPEKVALVNAINVSNGESLPQGTGYVNLTLSPVVARVGSFFYEFPPDIKTSMSAQFIVLHGNFIIKRVAAYDLSFTTRFQGEWPRALAAFEKNIIIGSGYGSVSLAVDNNYLRMLGETGLLGFVSFFVLFLSFAIYLKKTWKDLSPGLEKSFVIGFAAGIVGLALNATLIDVFEASKIAYVLWILMGVSFGIFVLAKKSEIDLLRELKKIATSVYAVVVYLFLLTVVLYSSAINNFFIGDDFTWLRWAAQAPNNLLTYFTQSDGFFYRPGTKLYFYLMYHFFWLNPVAYHLVSVFLHFGVSVLFFLLINKIFKNVFLSASAAFIFLILSGYTEMVFWIAATGHLINAVLGLLGLIFFIQWDEKRNKIFFVMSLLSFALALLFHELGVALPLLVLAYKAKDGILPLKNILKRKDFWALFIPVILYFILRIYSHSHWLNGDYSYDFLKLPFNFIGNALGYMGIILAGPSTLNFYEKIRIITRENLIISALIIFALLFIFTFVYKKLKDMFDKSEKQIIVFGFLFFLIALIPFLGLGNITSRYSYLATLGLIPILIVIIKKIYGYLLFNGKEIAVAAIIIIVMIFSLFHIISAQQTAADWAGASVKTNNFFVSFDSYYSNYWAKGNVQFHFINVPIRYGQSWVFPVGLNDAVWFAVENNDAITVQDKDVDTALNAVGSSVLNKIFVFNDDGSLTEITKRLFPVNK